VEDENAVSASVDVPVSRTGEQPDSHASSVNAVTPGNDSAHIVLDGDILGGMSDRACERYKDCIVKFAGSLAREASRLEEADRAEEVDKPEITATMIVKANDIIRNPPTIRPPTSIPTLIAQAVAFTAALLTPIFGADLHSDWQWTVTVLCGIIAVVAQVFAIIAVRRR
jgi:hypothetical protein